MACRKFLASPARATDRRSGLIPGSERGGRQLMSSSLGSKPEFPFWMLDQTRIKTWWLANAKAQLSFEFKEACPRADSALPLARPRENSSCDLPQCTSFVAVSGHLQLFVDSRRSENPPKTLVNRMAHFRAIDNWRQSVESFSRRRPFWENWRAGGGQGGQYSGAGISVRLFGL